MRRFFGVFSQQKIKNGKKKKLLSHLPLPYPIAFLTSHILSLFLYLLKYIPSHITTLQLQEKLCWIIWTAAQVQVYFYGSCFVVL